MIKKLAFVSALGLVVAPFATVHATESGPGCGIGTMVFSGKTGVANHLMAATTNDILLGSSSVTSGTFGCDSTQQVLNENNRERFVVHNLDSLTIDAAKGQGEYLAALAGVMGISETDKDGFYNLTQQNYDIIFGKSDVNAVEVLASLDKILAEDANFAKYIQ
jgi:hypothetical protein